MLKMIQECPGNWWNDPAIGGMIEKTSEMIAPAGEAVEKIGK